MKYVHHRHFHPKYPRKGKWVLALDKIMWGVAILAPFSTLPQVIDVYTTKRVAGLSPVTWFLFVISPCIWLSYGIVHRDKFIIINNILWTTLSASVFIGILLFS